MYDNTATVQGAVFVHKDMTIQEIVTVFPPAAEIMTEYGLHCFSCSIGGVETLEQGCQMHGLDEETLKNLLDDMNDALAEEPSRPAVINVTEAAAKGIAAISKEEGKEGQGLTVVVDHQGGFCMEFCEGPTEGDREFICAAEPGVKVFASPFNLLRIGGATIDMRDGRFKLELPEDTSCCGGDRSQCACDEKQH